MKYQWIIPLGAALGNVVLGSFVLARDRRPLHTAFALLTSVLVLWNLDIFGLYFFENPDTALTWTRTFRVGPILTPTGVITFAYVFAERTDWRWRSGVWFSAAISIVLLIANSFDLLVARLQKLDWGYYPVGTGFYNLLSLSFVLAVAYSSVVLLSEIRSSDSPRKRVQARLWLLAATAALPLGLTNLLPAYGVRVYPLGNLANVVYVGIVAYGIVRHRLMDIDVVVTKGMAYAAVSLVLIVPAFSGTLWLQRASFGRIHPEFSLAILLLLVAIGVLFPTLRLRAESRIEQSLFREKHQYRVALSAFTRSIVRILDRDKLIREVASTLSRTLGLDRIAIALLEEGKHAFTVQHAVGMPPATDEFPKQHPFITALTRCQEVVLREELEATSARAGVSEVCQYNGWEVCIPLTVGNELIGFISLGRKRNLEPFFAEDLELLGMLGAEASIALENARLYEELKRSQDIIRRADRLSALGTLAAGIAHEVRNPLVSIQTFFQLAPDRLHDEEFFSTFLGMAANEVKRISDLISELLSFARSPTRSLGPLNLKEVVERVVTLLEPEARKHKLTMTHVLPADLPLVHADSDQIKQVLINLMINAIQATPSGGTVSVVGQAVQNHDPPFVRLHVHDTGVGIPQERLNDIFNPFFTTKDKGTGLGLSIAHQIVVEHGGSLSVESKEGSGTSFFIDLPAAAQNTAVDVPAEERFDVDSPPLRREPLRKIAS